MRACDLFAGAGGGGGRTVSRKVLKLNEGDSADRQMAFVREIKTLRRLKSAHTVNMVGIVTSIRNQLVLVMEFMSGGTLYSYIERHRLEKKEISENVRSFQRGWVCMCVCAQYTCAYSKYILCMQRVYFVDFVFASVWECACMCVCVCFPPE